MSASLVGSEMCIRDRCDGPRDRRHDKGLCKCSTFLLHARRGGIAHAAVSYTHLTLPTICSV
eukprot:11074537-Alexandrium_andersonii.AAC.1